MKSDLLGLCDYWQCTTHNCNMTTDNEVKQHTNSTDEQCNLYPNNFKIKNTNKKRLQWVSRRVRDEYGMVIFKEDKKRKKMMMNTIPDGDMILTNDINALINERRDK